MTDSRSTATPSEAWFRLPSPLARWAWGFALAAAALTAGTAQAAKPGVEVTGSIPRGKEPVTMTLQVKMTSIDPGDVIEPAETMIKRTVGIKFTDYDERDRRVKYEDESGDSGTNPDGSVTKFIPGYVATILSASMDKSSTGSTYQLSFTLKIDTSNGEKKLYDPSLMKNANGKNYVRIDFYYVGKTSTSNKPESLRDAIVIEQSSGAANAAPADVAAEGIYRGIKVSWAPRDTIEYTGNVTSGAPTGVNILVFAEDVGTKELPGLAFKSDGGDEPFSACTLNTAGGANCLTCPAGTYLDIPAITKLGFAKVVAAGPAATPQTIAGLEPEKNYVAVMTYEPDGLKVSSCATAAPRLNRSLTELNKPGEEADLKDPRCFVATASYGSAYHESVSTLRWFRDAYLMPFALGKAAVHAYYRMSPPLARYIAAHEGWRTASRAALWPVVQSVRVLRYSPLLALVGMLACGGLLAWPLTRLRKRDEAER